MNEPINLEISRPEPIVCDVCFEMLPGPTAVRINFGGMDSRAIVPYKNNRDYNVCLKCFAQKLGITP